ncbi:MAG: heparinase II/III-family protein [Treponema sp.]|jgi:hypothetical protein|nr:heparinase II/III-family protein [Treponema sp.]
MIQETVKIGEFKPFPAYADRKSWESLPEEAKKSFTGPAEKLKNYQWPLIPAARLLDFYRDGNRSRHGELYFGRRQALLNLLLAECIEGRGEYLDDIINGVWLICEESSWVIPAHLNTNAQRRRSGEPVKEIADVEAGIYIDLFAAETGSLLAWVYYFLGDAIGALSPIIKRRIEIEVERRILIPYLEHSDYQWMGLDHGEPVNNWNPWINSNVLCAYLVFAKTFKDYLPGALKTIRSVNRFLHFYAEDGGCDEGPSYFDKAGAALFDYIEELGQVSDVSCLYKTGKIRNIASYIYKVYIGKNYYVNYADAAPMISEPAGVLERVARRDGDGVLLGFAAYLKQNGYCSSGEKGFMVYRRLSDLFSGPAESGAPLRLPQLSWFEGIQVLCARDKAGSPGGLFFSAKGGNNGESHNHNDVGNFLLYCDTVPVLVDAGVETYTKFTFSGERYRLWTMQSCYHNTPTINGADQLPGAEYRAGEAVFESGGGFSRLSLDIAGAYPKDAGIEAYRRGFTFKHGESLAVEDSYRLKELKAPLVLNFLCHERPELGEGRALLSGKLRMDYGPGFKAAAEEIRLEDEKIRGDWKKGALYRLRLTKEDTGLSGSFSITFTRN